MRNISIFDCFSPNGNNKLSNLRGIDLQEFLVLLDDVLIEYRDGLSFCSNDTFGTELEFENANVEFIGKNIFDDWFLKDEATVKNGAEVISPILRNDLKSWSQLEKICLFLNNNASIGSSCGGHLHVGVQVLGDNIDSWLNFVKLFSIYENIIFRFSYGEYLSYRTAIKCYALPVAERFYKIYNLVKQNNYDMDSLIYKLKFIRQQAVNFCNVDINNIGKFGNKNTIEFRCPNSSLNHIIWQNNVNFFLSFTKYCTSDEFNHDILDKRYKSVSDKMSNLVFYNEIYIEQALEISDMIFHTNLDKFYFLRQYFKSYEISNNFEKAKSFTKKRL